ncbi:hypothetical protein JJ685_12935 [Ramlibacter monticola]|uniref:Uncharacterized protein n=1 Tax=Ramlibacter monticola TaxID=1926872 RepID=A0A936Z0W5_9BURK|nr:hypothetical protein [Ramlibacter monticola]MBL0392039.1 hypothetical protein [Ramlibacter monticola]
MPWLVALLLALLLGSWAAWSRGLQAVAAVLAVAAFALAFVVGRRIEAQRDADWAAAARAVQGTFRAGDAGYCAGFGRPAPWDAWARDGELQCTRVIDGAGASPPFALVQIRYSVRESRGEEHPDSWYEVTVAVVRRPGAAGLPQLQDVPAPAGHAAVHNGQSVFVWKKANRGAGASLTADELPALLDTARHLAP